MVLSHVWETKFNLFINIYKNKSRALPWKGTSETGLNVMWSDIYAQGYYYKFLRLRYGSAKRHSREIVEIGVSENCDLSTIFLLTAVSAFNQPWGERVCTRHRAAAVSVFLEIIRYAAMCTILIWRGRTFIALRPSQEEAPLAGLLIDR